VVASSLVGDMYCLEHKIKSFDVLVKPLLDANISVDIFCGYNGGLDNLYYLKPFMYNIFPPLFALDKISSYKIYLSPTSIVSDEGCISYKTIEAMAFGCLVFTNWCYGIEDVCGENRDTIIYSNSPAETLEKVDYYLNNDEERIKIAKRGQEFVLSNYVWEDHFKRIILECGV
jgi:glycosyltransferase involved in cell wall biosynthesis